MLAKKFVIFPVKANPPANCMIILKHDRDGTNDDHYHAAIIKSATPTNHKPLSNPGKKHTYSQTYSNMPAHGNILNSSCDEYYNPHITNKLTSLPKFKPKLTMLPPPPSVGYTVK